MDSSSQQMSCPILVQQLTKLLPLVAETRNCNTLPRRGGGRGLVTSPRRSESTARSCFGNRTQLFSAELDLQSEAPPGLVEKLKLLQVNSQEKVELLMLLSF
ncbi:hypothetical protein AOLI_G00103860 [Acnodon oligacanthus]